jgi:hypothetical protein
MSIISYFSIIFFCSGSLILIQGIISRIRISHIFSELVPEINKYEYFDIVPLLISYYNSIFVLGIPLFCMGITINNGWDLFIINAVVWIGSLLFANICYLRLQNKLKSKGLELKLLIERLKNRKHYKFESQLIAIKAVYSNRRIFGERKYGQNRTKVAK